MEKAEQILFDIEKRIGHKPYFIAIDGRCASGKTTLAEEARKKWDCTVIHADDFFLRTEQRTKERLDTPGENIDHERLLSEVILPLKIGAKFLYRPFDCQIGDLGEEKYVTPKSIIVVEGSYCCNRELWEYFDLHVFLSIDRERQLERIRKRNPERYDAFVNKWIPLEENYFSHYDLKSKCELSYEL